MEKDFSILIIDDEAASRKNLQLIIENYCSGFSVAGEANSALSGLNQIKSRKPEIVLLDIEMPGGNGFEMLDALNEQTFELIFITAYNQFAIKAFKYSAIDYLTKPVDIDELLNALQNARERLLSNDSKRLDYKELFENLSPNGPTKLAIHTPGETEFIDINEIIRMEASGSYTSIYLMNNRKIVTSKSLKEYENLLSDGLFLRVHNSHLINLHYLKKYTKKDGYSAIMTDNSQIPIAVRKKESFELLMKQISK